MRCETTIDQAYERRRGVSVTTLKNVETEERDKRKEEESRRSFEDLGRTVKECRGMNSSTHPIQRFVPDTRRHESQSALPPTFSRFRSHFSFEFLEFRLLLLERY